MKNNFFKFSLLFVLLVALTGCPNLPDSTENNENNNDETPVTQTLTEKIAATQDVIDFEDATIQEDAVVSKALLIKNLNLGGKKITLEASGIELQNVKNATIIVDSKVGEGDVTLTGCSSIENLEIYGGGANSIHINNSSIASVQVKKDNVRVALEDSAKIESIVVEALNTKIESEENIVINSLSVKESVDKITIKGGTVNKIQVVADEEPAESGETEPSDEKIQIIIDGKTDVKTVEGETEVTLTEDAIKNGTNFVVEPIASFEGSRITFVSEGSVVGSEFENQDYYYEYVFDVHGLMDMDEALLKLYKFSDDIKAYIFYTDPDRGPVSTTFPDDFVFSEIPGKDFTIKQMYDMSLFLKSAGLVKGEFTAERVTLKEPDYYKEFDINNCGMPAELIYPKNPKTPATKITATEEGNVIEITLGYDANRIEVFTGEKDQNKWIPSKEPIFSLSENSQRTITFIDRYVDSGKEYAYFVNVERNYYGTSVNKYVTVTAQGGNGELSIIAENSTEDEGIKLTLSGEVKAKEYDGPIFPNITRVLVEDEEVGYVRITNFNNETFINPIIDYFVDENSEYKYVYECKLYTSDMKSSYMPHTKAAVIKATSGLKEPKLTKSPVITFDGEKTVTFTTKPEVAVTNWPEDFTASLSLQYSYEYDKNCFDGQTIDYDLINQEENSDISLWYNSTYRGTYKYENQYSLYISYDNKINYLYVSKEEHDSSGLIPIEIK